MHRGDGTDRSAQATGAITRTILGGSGPGVGTPEAEGQPAAKVNVPNMSGNTRAADGTTYFANWGREHGIFRVGTDGKVRRIAGKRSTATDLAKRLEEEGPPTGDGGPAVDAVLGGNPIAMSVGPDGSLYFVITPGGATYPRGLIRKITPGGTISTVAGSLDAGVGYQDGVPGPQTAVTDPQAVLAASDGSLYWTERPQTTNGMKGRLRRLSASGLVETVAGGGTDNLPADDQDLGDGEPARDNDFGGVPYGLAMGPDGSLYFALPTEHIVERVAPDGRIHRIAGNRTDPVGPPTYGEQAVASSIGNPTGVAVGPNGEVYIRHDEPGSPSAVFISQVRPDGVLEHVAGLPRGLCGGLSQDGEQATRTCIESLQGRGLMVDPDGSVIYQDGTAQLRRVEPALPGFGRTSTAVPSTDGSEVWEFDATGRHLRTVDGLTGVKLERFSYDADGRLTGVEDRDGNTTTIERAADGTPQAIVASGGQRTTLDVDGAGRVAAVRDPAGRASTMTYGDGDLLATLKRPDGGTSTLTYDARGRLTKDVDPDGVITTLDRTQNDGKTTVTCPWAAGSRATASRRCRTATGCARSSVPGVPRPSSWRAPTPPGCAPIPTGRPRRSSRRRTRAGGTSFPCRARRP